MAMFRRGAARKVKRYGSRRRPIAIALTSLASLAIGGSLITAISSASAIATYNPVTDPYSMAAVTADLGVSDWWNAGYTGQGVDVAVIDSGVAPVEGLKGAGKVIYGPDLSLESQAPNLRNLDTFGHGTFMAGLIAGKDTALTKPYANAPATAYRGIAPDARIVSLKVATADGGADVTQVIAAINWVVEHKNDNGLNIRVLNLSYGTNSGQAADVDPLSFAVEQAWKKGIIVVASAGNTGYQKGVGAPGLSSPAYNPFVMAVGGFDSMGTSSLKDDQVGVYSASSAGCKKLCKDPDFVAAGSHMQGLRVPNSFIDSTFSAGRLGDRYFRGSGTSQAAAVASGTAALVLQQNPTFTPDEVKAVLQASAKKVSGFDKRSFGAGEIDMYKLFTGKYPKNPNQNFPGSTGTGSLELSRGRGHVARNAAILAGEKDIFGKPVNTAVLAAAEAQGSTWSGGTWNGSTWSGGTWSGSTWSGSTWSGSTWSGSTWSGSTWSGSTWSGSTWSGSTWSGSSWSGSQWDSSIWATGTWA
jgi:serine protease AprX